MTRLRLALVFGVMLAAIAVRDAASLQPPAGGQRGQDPLAEPFKGVTVDGTVKTGLFPIRSTGVSTAAVRDAAVRFLDSLTADERRKTAYSVDDAEWRKWNNVHRYARQGTSFKEMTGQQRERAFDLLGGQYLS